MNTKQIVRKAKRNNRKELENKIYEKIKYQVSLINSLKQNIKNKEKTLEKHKKKLKKMENTSVKEFFDNFEILDNFIEKEIL